MKDALGQEIKSGFYSIGDGETFVIYFEKPYEPYKGQLGGWFGQHFPGLTRLQIGENACLRYSPVSPERVRELITHFRECAGVLEQKLSYLEQSQPLCTNPGVEAILRAGPQPIDKVDGVDNYKPK
jgi:hypothetical protein